MPRIQKKEDKTTFRLYVDKKNVSLVEMSLHTDIPYHTLYQLVMGSFDNPTKKMIDTVLIYLKCTYEDIFTVKY